MAATIRAQVYRFDPERDSEPALSAFELATYPNMSVLDLLFQVVEEHEPDLSFRFSCRVGMCGSCGMLVNGREALACQTAVGELGDEVTIRPLNHLPVEKDLLVDLGPLFASFERADASFVGEDGQDELVTVVPEPGDMLATAGDCISCGLCVSACSVLSFDPDYIGPAALFRTLTLIEDKREPGPERRLDKVNDEHGIWRCHSHMDCVAACPKDLPLTQAIMKLKRLSVKRAFRRPLRP
jgi:succinate dehydrogenase/fumarate reductase iron-sulfur protein